MLPTGLTIAALIADAGTVVSAFGDVITFVVVLGLGIWVVTAIPAWIRSATHND